MPCARWRRPLEHAGGKVASGGARAGRADLAGDEL